MAVSKTDEKLKKVFFLEDEILTPLVAKALEGRTDKTESVQLQLSTKGYDNRKDPRMTKDIVFPNIMRSSPKIAVIGDEKARAAAEGLNIPFFMARELEGDAFAKQRAKIIKNHRYLILCPNYQPGFNLREILKKRRTHFICQDLSKLATLYNDLLYTYRLKIRDWFAISFPVGHSDMSVPEIVANIKHGVQFVADNLKKGPQNVKECFIKRTSGPQVRVN